MQYRRIRAVPLALLTAALSLAAFAGTAQAKLTGEFVKFQYCPYKNAEVKKCLWANTEGGEVKLGNKTVKIEHSVLLQGGLGAVNKETKVQKFIAPTSSQPALAPVAQNVPGGLLGIVPEKEQNWLIKKLIKFFFENSLTGLNSTLELAGSASLIEVSEAHLNRKELTALHMPIKVHLENPFLGSKCYVGSDASPITWNLTTGVTTPPGGFTAMEGSAGTIESLEEGTILHLTGNKMVENNWSAPKATGCGGLLAFLVNPIVNTQLGTTTAGNNKALLENTINIATAFAVNENDELHP